MKILQVHGQIPRSKQEATQDCSSLFQGSDGGGLLFPTDCALESLHRRRLLGNRLVNTKIAYQSHQYMCIEVEKWSPRISRPIKRQFPRYLYRAVQMWNLPSYKCHDAEKHVHTRRNLKKKLLLNEHRNFTE
jgi:hypothetical protein